MAKIIDITDKLKFNERPKLRVRGKDIEVNTDAQSVLLLLAEIGNGDDIKPETIGKIATTIFPEKSQKTIDDLHLDFGDYSTLIQCAMDLVVGENDNDSPNA